MATSAPNPYQAPQAPGISTHTKAGARVDGKHLVVPSGVVLPQFCIKTNEPVSVRHLRPQRLHWCPPWVALLILVSGLLLIIVYFVARKQCLITYGISPEVKRKYRNRLLVKSVLAAALFISLPIVAGADLAPLILLVVLLFLVSIVALCVGNSPLAVAKHRDGEFWLTGCSPDFLARIES